MAHLLQQFRMVLCALPGVGVVAAIILAEREIWQAQPATQVSGVMKAGIIAHLLIPLEPVLMAVELSGIIGVLEQEAEG